jgi:hypothetical protein
VRRAEGSRPGPSPDAAAFVGTLDTDCGTAQLYRDGKRLAEIDGYNDDGERRSEGLWGEFDLPPGRHTVRVVVDGKPYPASKGAWVHLEDLIVYKKQAVAAIR